MWITEALRGQTATLERLRMDRQLEETLTHGPDPLHLAEVFGLDEKTAIRYANSARQILERPWRTTPQLHREPKTATPRIPATDPRVPAEVSCLIEVGRALACC
ncbi:hypothetical protein OG625_20720 [Streptomyces sp. NBC_01351]|uniref:hypothetical protein n=1 Tax=Streptomyces sp. NBC_01351 TaxID=2903833 RepID=UPI002E37B4E6|nr:hypothetical protein [Streptomyces sp. NBC_01351]